MLILGIESSCDDTSVALLECGETGHTILAQKTASQIEIHKKYGGVVPEIAGRMHAEAIAHLVEEALSPLAKGGLRGVAVTRTAKSKKDGEPHLTSPSEGEVAIQPEAVAVTNGPGLITGLIVGVEAARTMSAALNIPLISVNHIEGHIHSVELGQTPPVIPTEPVGRAEGSLGFALDDNAKPISKFPAIVLVVSGGHTEIVLMLGHGNYKILGQTRDDAAGECFDKVAKLLSLPYPGGPEISRLAEKGNPTAIDFPRPMLRENNYDFSFSGLKTSALYYLRDHALSPLAKGGLRGVVVTRTAKSKKDGEPHLASPSEGEVTTIADFCASIEQAIVDVLVGKTLRAALEYQPKTVLLVGGVAANKKLRETLKNELDKKFPEVEFRIPELKYCMDNGAMIAAAGFWKAQKKDFTPWREIAAKPNLEIVS